MPKPIFTTKHYKAIVKILKKELLIEISNLEDTSIFWYTVDKFCDDFKKDNPKFDEEKFRKSLIVK